MRIILTLIASAGLVSCVGDVSPPIVDDGSGTPEVDNPTGADLTPAKQLYDDNVFSIMKQKCDGGLCHAEVSEGGSITKFVATDKANGWTLATNYVTLVGGYTAAAPILTKIEPGTHKEVRYDQAEKDKITAWLAKELELRQGLPPGEPPGESLSAAADRVMSQFAGCMTLENFTASNFAQAWGNLQSNEGACEKCHGSGGYGFIAYDVSKPMLDVVGVQKMYWLQYFTVDLSGGAMTAKVLPNKVSFAGVCNRAPPHQAHPTFPCANNAGITALQNFYDRTVAEIAKPDAICKTMPKPLQN